MKSILVILSTMLIIGGISSAYSESISLQLDQELWYERGLWYDQELWYERGLWYDQVQCVRLDHVFIGPITTSLACVHKKVAEEFKIPTYSTLPSEYNTTQNIVTTDFNFKKTNILESNETNFITNVGDTIPPNEPSLGYRSFFWPQYTVIFPKQVQVGEPFDIVLDYTFVLPSIEYVNNTGIEVWGNNSELQCPASRCERYNIQFLTPLNVDLLNESNYTFVKNIPNEKYVENISKNLGYVHRPYNNTYPQQENFTLVINTPTIDFNYGSINVEFIMGFHGTVIYFYIAPNNTVYLTPAVNFAPGEGMHQLTKYIDPTPIVLPSHPRVYTAEQLEFTKDFIQENYPDADIEQKLRDLNAPEEFIEQFFSTYPELRKQSQQTCIYDGSWFAFLCIFF